MPNLFGLDIANLVNTAITSAGGVLDVQLIKVRSGTRDPSNITGGLQPVETSVACRGFIESKTDSRIGDSIVAQGGEFVSILGASIADQSVVPEANDKVIIEGTTYRIIEITERDPAAALYVMRVES